MQTTSSLPAQAVTEIRRHCGNFKPTLGLILGSGLGGLANQIEDAVVIPYQEIPGFHVSTVQGHAGKLILGKFAGMPVVCLQGRAHGYEGATGAAFKTMIRTLRLLGCESLIITNASGSLRLDVGPGELMLIKDHISLQPNPLIGPNDEEFGPRFFSMDKPYDLNFRQRLQQIAQQLNINLTEGVYLGVTGPTFETHAEIRAFRTLGAEAVGMSTVGEVIVARHCGLRVAVVATITNYAAGLSDEILTHEATLHMAQQGAQNLTKLIHQFVLSLSHDPC